MASIISSTVSKCLSDQLKMQNSAINEMEIMDTKHIRKLQSLIRDTWGFQSQPWDRNLSTFDRKLRTCDPATF